MKHKQKRRLMFKEKLNFTKENIKNIDIFKPPKITLFPEC